MARMDTANRQKSVPIVARGSQPGAFSGIQPVDPPAVDGVDVAEAVVQTIVAVLPELVGLRGEPIAAPRARAPHALISGGRELADSTFQLCATREDGALPRRGCTEPAALRTRGEVLVRLGCGHALNSPFDAHLASERIPVEEESRARIRVELRTLPAHVAGEEHEAPLVRGLEEQHPHGWGAVRGRGRDRHRLRQPHDRPCLLEPAPKLLDTFNP